MSARSLSSFEGRGWIADAAPCYELLLRVTSGTRLHDIVVQYHADSRNQGRIARDRERLLSGR